MIENISSTLHPSPWQSLLYVILLSPFLTFLYKYMSLYLLSFSFPLPSFPPPVSFFSAHVHDMEYMSDSKDNLQKSFAFLHVGVGDRTQAFQLDSRLLFRSAISLASRPSFPQFVILGIHPGCYMYPFLTADSPILLVHLLIHSGFNF